MGTKRQHTTALPRNLFTGGTSTDGGHVHDVGVAVYAQDAANPISRGLRGTTPSVSTMWWATSGTARTYWSSKPNTNRQGAHAHTVNVNGGGDSETAPDHFVLSLIIRAK